MSATEERDTEQGLIEKARRVLPGGSFGNFSSDIVIREGRGGRVWDESGNEYIDFLLGSGPMLVGHAHPEVTAAAQARIAQGTTFFANNRYGIELAEAIVAAVPCAEQVRFVSTGSRPCEKKIATSDCAIYCRGVCCGVTKSSSTPF